MEKKVLVVDDEKLIVKGIRFSLEQEGMTVDCAYDGEEALAAIRQNQYDVIDVNDWVQHDELLDGRIGY